MNIEIMLMPDGHKTSGVLLKCEDDHIALGNELWVYPMIWGVRPIDNKAEIFLSSFPSVLIIISFILLLPTTSLV